MRYEHRFLSFFHNLFRNYGFNNRKFSDHRSEIYHFWMIAEEVNTSNYSTTYTDFIFMRDNDSKLPKKSKNHNKRLLYFHSLQFVRYAQYRSHYHNFTYRHKLLADWISAGVQRQVKPF